MTETIYHKKSGMNFNKVISDNNNKFFLVSIGTRTKFKLVFYGVGFYSNKPDYYNDNLITEKSFDSDDKNLLVFRFYRGISREKILTAFREAIENRVNEGEYLNEGVLFESFFYNVEQLNYEDTLQFTFSDSLNIYHNNLFLGKIDNRGFMKVLFSIFMDNNSVTPDIKQIQL